MRLKHKAIIGFNVFLLIVAVCVGVLAYRTANEGFKHSLEMKAEGDLHAFAALLDYKCPGPWVIKGDALYKGETKIDGNFDLADSLKQITDSHVTIFKGDTRVTTSFSGSAAGSSSRPVGTKASAAVIEQVLNKQQSFLGEANVLGNNYTCAYMPLKSADGKTIGMLFSGIRKVVVEEIQKQFIISIVTATVILIVVAGHDRRRRLPGRRP
jgi:methyl-accepting chemotaxis protein